MRRAGGCLHPPRRDLPRTGFSWDEYYGNYSSRERGGMGKRCAVATLSSTSTAMVFHAANPHAEATCRMRHCLGISKALAEEVLHGGNPELAAGACGSCGQGFRSGQGGGGNFARLHER